MALVSRRRIKLRPFPIQRGVDVGHVRASIGHHVMPVADKKSSAFPWWGTRRASWSMVCSGIEIKEPLSFG